MSDTLTWMAIGACLMLLFGTAGRSPTEPGVSLEQYETAIKGRDARISELEGDLLAANLDLDAAMAMTVKLQEKAESLGLELATLKGRNAPAVSVAPQAPAGYYRYQPVYGGLLGRKIVGYRQVWVQNCSQGNCSSVSR